MIPGFLFRLIVRPDPVVDEKEIKTDSGLVVKLALAVDEKLERGATTTGEILSIGPDAFAAFKPSVPLAGLEVGDRIAWAKYSGKWVVDPETKEEVLAINDEDVVVKLPKVVG